MRNLIYKVHQPCPCGTSSDAYNQVTGKCFSCGKVIKYTGGTVVNLMDIKQANATWKFLPDRGITGESYEFYNTRTIIPQGEEPLYRLYPFGGVATKKRFLRRKDFRTEGPIADAGLFGKDKFPPGSAKSITVTEGEEDAISVFQMLGSRYPAVSVQSSSSALRDCTIDFDYLNSFEKIYLCFDNDEPGKKACLQVQELFDPLKICIVKISGRYKDANDYLVANDVETFKKLWWSAKPPRPEGIVATYDEVDNIIDTAQYDEGISLPTFLPRLQEMTGGLRRGESWLWTAREGTGKTEILRAVEKAIIDQAPEGSAVGIIHAEERKDRLYAGLVGLYLGRPAHRTATAPALPPEDIKREWRSLTQNNPERAIVFSLPETDDPDVLLNGIRYLAVGYGCWGICFDHIGYSVTGSMGDDATKKLDYISTRLETLVKKHNFHLSFVSHVNDNLETRGSRNISKICDVWIHLERPIEHEVDIVRNTTTLTVRKNRPTSYSGPAGQILFDPNSFSYRVKNNDLPIE